MSHLLNKHHVRIPRAIHMGTSDPGRQFLMIPFRDLDSPAFMRLARSPAFSTYLTLRRYIWRSAEPHSRNLQQWYPQGYLCSGLSRQQIASCLGQDIQRRSVTSDINRLRQLGVIEVQGRAQNQVFVLGHWEKRDALYIEHYYIERLTGAEGTLATYCQGDSDPVPPGDISPPTLATSCHEPWQIVATMNKESLNTECRIEAVSSPSKSDVQIWKAVLDELRLQLTRATYDTWVARTSARRVDGGWEITCINGLAQDWLEHQLLSIIRRELAAVVGEGVGQVRFRAKDSTLSV